MSTPTTDEVANEALTLSRRISTYMNENPAMDLYRRSILSDAWKANIKVHAELTTRHAKRAQ